MTRLLLPNRAGKSKPESHARRFRRGDERAETLRRASDIARGLRQAVEIERGLGGLAGLVFRGNRPSAAHS